MTTTLPFNPAGAPARAVAVRRAIVAGWTGRDRGAVDHHIAELAALGVAPPSEVPLFYRVGAALATREAAIEVVGGTTSGEVEPVLIDDGEGLWLGLGSDHTDRALEAHSVALSKQICPKPVAGELWPWEEVRDHLDALELRSWIRDSPQEAWTPYQEGTLAALRPLPELVERAPAAAGEGRLQPGTLMMCGTLVAIGGVRPARHFRMELRDPVRGRTIGHGYEAAILPVVS
jgi:hypothetical protein